MRYLIAFMLVLMLPLTSTAEGKEQFYVPPGQLSATMQVMKLGLSNITALFGNATGSFKYDPQTQTVSTLRIAVDTTSLVSTPSDNQSALSNMLGANQYAEIRFTALDDVKFTDGKASVKGTLTVHGASKPITLDAVVNTVPGNDANKTWAKSAEELGLSLHGSFKRAEFGMTDASDAPALFGDTISLQLELQAIKQ